MKSRGFTYELGAGARKSLVLLWTAVLVCSLLLQYAAAATPAPAIAASGLKAGTVAGFEVDGDLNSGNAAGNPGNIPAGLYAGLANAQDWLDGNGINGVVDPADPPQSFIFRDAVDKASVPGDSAPDTSAYVGGNKEDDTRNWGYINSSGPNDKTDYRHVMAGVKVSGGSPYVFLGAERIDTNGDMVVDFELNQKPFKVFPGASGVEKPDRSINDILISLEYANGGTNPEVTLYRVSAVQAFNSGQVVTFSKISDAKTVDAVRSATNFQALANVAFPSAIYTVPAFAWAEASVNIAALDLPVTCLNFGQGSIRSRTGGAPDASQLKDASQPFPLSVNTCAQIRIEKVDKDGDHLAGATFEIAPNPLLGAPANSTLTITDDDPNDLDPRDGYILIGPCEPQVSYTVTEKTAPVGYIKDPDPQSKTASAGETVTFKFTNGLGSIRWEKNRTGGTTLGGATFTITPDPRDWNGTMTVVDNGPMDADADPGEFRVTGVRVDRDGGYVIAESDPPTGWIGSSATATVNPTSSDPNVSVAAQTWVNSLGSLRWVKNGPNGTDLLGGATFTVTPDPRDGVGTLVIVDNDANDTDDTDGEFRVNNARTGPYSVQETAAPTGYILDANSAGATISADPNGEHHPQIAIGTFVNHLGTIRWLKYGPDGQTLLGGAVFSVTPDPANGTTGSISVGDCQAPPCNGPDKDETPGEFELQNVRVGSYAIVETIAPAGYVLSDAQLTANIASPMAAPYTANAGSVTNRLGTISWVKNGPDKTSLLGGAVFTITPNPRTGDGELIVGDDGDNDANKTPGEFQVTGVRVNVAGGYSIAETTAPAGYVGDFVTTRTVNPTTANPDVSVAAGTWINTLGSLAWEKRDGNEALLGGATFLLEGPNGLSLTILDNDANDADKDAGQFKVNSLFLGAYTVTETIAPAGYVMDTTPRIATLTAVQPDVEITDDFVNTLGSLAWVKKDAKGNLLGGATFQVTGPFAYDVSVLDDSALDADKVAGQFKILDLKLGTYTVTETAAPAGYILDPASQDGTLTQAAPNATIAKAFVNTLGELLWTKDKGDDAKTPLGGATFSVTPNPFTGSGSLTVADNDASDQDKANGVFHLVDVRVGTYTVVETAAPEGYLKSTATCRITVSAANPTGVPACSFSNPPIKPDIEIVKTAGTSLAGQAADGATLEVEALPNNVTYKYVVTNPGDVRLVNVTVTDDNGTPGNTADDFAVTSCEDEGANALTVPFQLAAGATMACYATLSITANTTNIATAKGFSVGERTEVTDTDDAIVKIVGPAITIVKTAGASAGSQAADGATYVTEDFANNVTYTYLVTNSGTTSLNTVILTDNKLGAITCPKMTLAVAESMTCTATTGVSVDTTNIGSVSGTSPSGTTKTATDDAKVDVVTPRITVVKIAGGAADGTTLYTSGGDVTYSYLVTNAGEVALTNVSLTDNKLGAITCPKAALAIGESMTCTTTAAVNVDTTNIATVTGDTPHATVSDFDDAVVLVRRVAIDKTNDAEGKQAPGSTVAYQLTLTVQNGPIPAMTVKDVLPANFGSPSAISDGGTYDAASRTITWTLANVANGKTLTYDVVIATTTQGGSYLNTATITDGPCVAGDCDDTSVVPVWRVSIDKTNDATKPLLEGANVIYTLAFAVQNGPITSMVVTDTLPAQVVNPRAFSVAPVSIVGQVITWNLKDVADGSTITYTASIATGTVTGSYKNVAVITQGPCVGDECTDDSVVNTGQVEEATGTPTITPPPTDTLPSESGQAGSSLLLLLFAFFGLVAVLGVVTPIPTRVRRQGRRG